MLVNINGAKCIGIDAVRVTVEVKIDSGVGIHLVGLADTAVKESLLRTVTALQSLSYHIPGKKIVINLAPADLQKKGTGYDLPIALGIIVASEQVTLPGLGKYIIMGELGLDGSIRDIPGALAFAELAMKEGYEGCILPMGSALEAVELQETKVYGVRDLKDVIWILKEEGDTSDLLVWNTDEYRRLKRARHHLKSTPSDLPDFADIVGQEGAKRALEIAASGNHNVILLGPPGAGKSSLAKAMSGILPLMTREESIITSKIYSVAGKGASRYGLMRERPVRCPHHSASLPAMVGGGNGDNIVPGEISLADNGILFLDEFAEMPKSVIQALRAPLEDRKVVISRLRSKIEYPANFMLVAASNPCPCGYYGDGDRCSCTPVQRSSYLGKLSGPLMDRIDLQVFLKPVDTGSMISARKGEPSATVAERVLKARIKQKLRFASEGILTNSEMNNSMIEKYCPLSQECKNLMQKLIDQMHFSMRAYFRIIRVARTIADLADSEDIRPEHLMEASSYRFLDRQNHL